MSLFDKEDFNLELYRYSDKDFSSTLKRVIEFYKSTPLTSFPPPVVVNEKGVYGLYYFGSYSLYEPLVTMNKNGQLYPIYIGKAIASGARTGAKGQDKTITGRLNEHHNSISEGGLEPAEFRCKFVILTGDYEDILEATEKALIRAYRPIWNKVVSGFGIHVPGSGRDKQKPSEWDTLHSGRRLASALTGEKRDISKITAKAEAHLKGLKPL